MTDEVKAKLEGACIADIVKKGGFTEQQAKCMLDLISSSVSFILHIMHETGKHSRTDHKTSVN